MNILISGGFGYIGSNITNSLLNAKHNVGIISRNKAPGYFNNLDEHEIVLADIREPINYTLKNSYDLCIHLAAANDIDSRDQQNALLTTTLGTKNVLDFCVKNNIKKFIYFSTFQVYGKDEGFVDESTPVDLKNHYSLTHYFAEKYVELYNKNHGLEYVIVRPTNIYGCPADKSIDRWSLVPGCFCKEAFEKSTITLLSSGKQSRDFVSLDYVSKVTDFFINNFDEVKNNIFNLSSGKATSIIETAELVKECYSELFNSKCSLEVLGDSPSKSSELFASNEKLEKMKFISESINSMKEEINKTFYLLSRQG